MCLKNNNFTVALLAMMAVSTYGCRGGCGEPEEPEFVEFVGEAVERERVIEEVREAEGYRLVELGDGEEQVSGSMVVLANGELDESRLFNGSAHYDNCEGVLPKTGQVLFSAAGYLDDFKLSFAAPDEVEPFLYLLGRNGMSYCFGAGEGAELLRTALISDEWELFVGLRAEAEEAEVELHWEVLPEVETQQVWLNSDFEGSTVTSYAGGSRLHSSFELADDSGDCQGYFPQSPHLIIQTEETGPARLKVKALDGDGELRLMVVDGDAQATCFIAGGYGSLDWSRSLSPGIVYFHVGTAAASSPSIEIELSR